MTTFRGVRWRQVEPARAARAATILATAFAATTVVISTVESAPFSVANAASLYLVPVTIAARYGVWSAVATAAAAFLAYDLFFVAPRFTLAVDDPREWLDLSLFLIVGLTVARLTAVQAMRTDEAERRLREAAALFRVSRTLATTGRTDDALGEILDLLLAETGGDAIRVTRGDLEVCVAARGTDRPAAAPRIVNQLLRRPGSEPARWIRTHAPSTRSGTARAGSAPSESGATEQFKVAIEAEGTALGDLVLIRSRDLGAPNREATRLLALVADQVGLAWRRDRLRADAEDAALARRTEAAQGALLESVSHDLRTPLASIRAAAGALADPAVGWPPAKRREVASRIDAEADRLDDLVRGLLDLSRIRGGSLVPRVAAIDLADVVDAVLRRHRDALPEDLTLTTIDATVPPVLADPVLLDQVLSNVVRNVIEHAPGARLTISAAGGDPLGFVRVRIEDAGPGVRPAELKSIFDRFYRGRGAAGTARRGTGIGLAIVRGAVEAMGGYVSAERSTAGGLAVVLRLPAASVPADAA